MSGNWSVGWRLRGLSSGPTARSRSALRIEARSPGGSYDLKEYPVLKIDCVRSNVKEYEMN